MDGRLVEENEDLTFVAVGTVTELLSELGAKGEGPTVDAVVWAKEVPAWLDALVAAGEDVLPRVDGRGMCFDF